MRRKGVLEVCFSLTCGLCGTGYSHPWREITKFTEPAEIIERVVIERGWKRTRKYGLVCSCDAERRDLERLHRKAARKAARHNEKRA